MIHFWQPSSVDARHEYRYERNSKKLLSIKYNRELESIDRQHHVQILHCEALPSSPKSLN